MIDIVSERWSETGNRVDLEVAVKNFWGAEKFRFKTHIVGQGLKAHAADDMVATMIEQKEQSQHKTGKNSLVFPMRSLYNATGYITNNNIPEAWQTE